MWQQWLCVLSVLLCDCVLSCCAKPLRGDNGRRGAEWGDKFRMRGSDEAFCRPPVGPQSCTASDGCIYCRPTSTSFLITRIDKLALPHLLTTHTKTDRRHLNGSCGKTRMPPPSFLSLLLAFCFSPQITSQCFFQGLNTVWAPVPFCGCFFFFSDVYSFNNTVQCFLLARLSIKHLGPDLATKRVKLALG